MPPPHDSTEPNSLLPNSSSLCSEKGKQTNAIPITSFCFLQNVIDKTILVSTPWGLNSSTCKNLFKLLLPYPLIPTCAWGNLYWPNQWLHWLKKGHKVLQKLETERIVSQTSFTKDFFYADLFPRNFGFLLKWSCKWNYPCFLELFSHLSWFGKGDTCYFASTPPWDFTPKVSHLSSNQI